MSDHSLFARCQAGDAEARSELLRMHVGIVHFIARRLARSLSDEVELDELVSAGHLGLMAAVENFDESRGLAFCTFAATRVRGAMLDDLRRLDPVPRSVRAKARQLHAVRNTLGNRLGRRPTQRELATEIGLPLDRFWRWQVDVERAADVSLDAPAAHVASETDSFGALVACYDMDPAERIDRDTARAALRAEMSVLGDVERRVLAMSFFEEMTLQEIAPYLGVSESRVSQIRSGALTRLRSRLAHRGVHAAA